MGRTRALSLPLCRRWRRWPPPGSVRRGMICAHRDCDVGTEIGACAVVQAEFDDAAVARIPLPVGPGGAEDRCERDGGFPEVDPVAVRADEEGEVQPHRPGDSVVLP
jgi:hypothetical protein